MKVLDLNGTWNMRRVGSEESFSSEVPGSVAATLLACGKMEDPYDRDNEVRVQTVFEADYEFTRAFRVTRELLSHDRILLVCHGLDTIAAIYLNGRVIAETNNMHRKYVFDVKDSLLEGENYLAVRFSSPIRYLDAHPSKTGRKFSVIRKAACMFGWDWGLSLPDMGIWRDIGLEAFDGARLSRVVVRQKHVKQNVDLEIDVYTDV